MGRNSMEQKDMETKECLVQPKIASKILELNQEHALPLNIVVGGVIEGLKKLTFEYELIDYHLVAWLLNKGTAYYTGLPYEEIMDDDD